MARPRLLVAYSNEATFVTTTMEYLSSFKLHSRFDVSYLHVTHGAEIDFDLNMFDAVFNSYCARLCVDGYVSESYQKALKGFSGVKLLALQDEYEQTNAVRKAIQDLQFDVVFTCVPQEAREYVYPSALFLDTEFATVLTGYVPASLKERGRRSLPLVGRPITIGYRARSLTARYGRLGFEKFEIGRRMQEVCIARGIAHDIDMSEDKRIYGEAWYDFLGSCRATLGSESGSNCFDFDGSLAARYQELKTAKGEELAYEEFRPYTDPLEDRVAMGQISPRVFEAAAVGTPMILFSGRYSNILTPGAHYIELSKDFSNIDSVLQQLDDIGSLQRLSETAYDHLIASGNYDYQRFVETVDAIIDRKRAEKAIPESLGLPREWAVRNPLDSRSLVEYPTAVPRDPAVLLYKQALREKVAFAEEIARLEEIYPAEIERLNQVYPAEIARLKQGYSAEIARLNNSYPAEIARLNEVYTAEIARLNETHTAEIVRLNQANAAEIARLNETYTAEIARLNNAHTAEITRLNEIYTAEIARLNETYTAEIARLNETYTAEIARLNARIAETEGFRGLCLLSYRLVRKVLTQSPARLGTRLKLKLPVFFGRL